LSADSQSEEAAADFMKAFVPLLFDAPNTIDQEQKANFGQMVLVLIKCYLKYFNFIYSFFFFNKMYLEEDIMVPLNISAIKR